MKLDHLLNTLLKSTPESAVFYYPKKERERVVNKGVKKYTNGALKKLESIKHNTLS